MSLFKNSEMRILRELDSDSYIGMMISASNFLQNNKDYINKLNVFPVPDGDTGSNMSLTLSSIRNELNGKKLSLSEASEKVASLSLMSARGNSGVILSLFLRGLSKGFKKIDNASISDIIDAYKWGVEEAYNAVQHPTEGTILTVMRVGIENTNNDFEYIHSVNELFERILDYSKAILAETPNMLPQLKQAKVVDAGGAGFVSILEGIVSYLNGNPVEGNIAKEDFSGNTVNFDEYDEFDSEHPYCTECIITKSADFIGEGNAEEFKKFVLSAGNSAVFVDTDDIIKVHVHTKDPGAVLTEAIKYGKFYSVKVENMENQHTSLLSNGSDDHVNDIPVPQTKTAELTEYGFVAVTPGDGIMETFKELGVTSFVKGGQTMNPSTEQMLKAINEVNSRNVIVFPNNSNICLVAEQCVPLCKDKNVVVIPTYSVPQGISSLLAFDYDASLQENIDSMNEAKDSVITLEMTFAARNSQFDGNDIKEGQILGLVDHKLKYVTDSINKCIDSFINEIKSSYYVTVYYGSDITEKEAEKVLSYIKRNLPEDCEISLIYGGQPLYYYIISAE